MNDQAATARELAVRQIIADLLSMPLDEVTADKSLAGQLGADSIDIVELSMYAEDEFAIEIPDEEVEAWKTVGDVIATAHRHALDELTEDDQ